MAQNRALPEVLSRIASRCLPLSLIVSPRVCLCSMVSPRSQGLVSLLVSLCWMVCPRFPGLDPLCLRLSPFFLPFVGWCVFPGPCLPCLPACFAACLRAGPLSSSLSRSLSGCVPSCFSLVSASRGLVSLASLTSLSPSLFPFLFPFLGWCVRLPEALSRLSPS